MFLQAKRLVITEAQYGEQRQEAIHVIISNIVFKTLIATSLTLNVILEITINWWKRLHPVADTPHLNQCTFAIQVLVDTGSAQPALTELVAKIEFNLHKRKICSRVSSETEIH